MFPSLSLNYSTLCLGELLLMAHITFVDNYEITNYIVILRTIRKTKDVSKIIKRFHDFASKMIDICLENDYN